MSVWPVETPGWWLSIHPPMLAKPSASFHGVRTRRPNQPHPPMQTHGLVPERYKNRPFRAEITPAVLRNGPLRRAMCRTDHSILESNPRRLGHISAGGRGYVTILRTRSEAGRCDRKLVTGEYVTLLPHSLARDGGLSGITQRGLSTSCSVAPCSVAPCSAGHGGHVQPRRCARAGGSRRDVIPCVEPGGGSARNLERYVAAREQAAPVRAQDDPRATDR